jgi:hypothetical protein
MPISEDDWARAHDESDLLTTLHDALIEHWPQALRVNDLLRDAGPGGPEEHGLWGAFTEAIQWQFSRSRSKAVVESTLETLVYHGLAEKRALEHEGEITIYYRALKPEDRP